MCVCVALHCLPLLHNPRNYRRQSSPISDSFYILLRSRETNPRTTTTRRRILFSVYFLALREQRFDILQSTFNIPLLWIPTFHNYFSENSLPLLLNHQKSTIPYPAILPIPYYIYDELLLPSHQNLLSLFRRQVLLQKILQIFLSLPCLLSCPFLSLPEHGKSNSIFK